MFVLVGTKKIHIHILKIVIFFVQPSRYEGKSVVIDGSKNSCKTNSCDSIYQQYRDQIRNANEGVIVELSVDGIYKGLKEMVLIKQNKKKFLII